VGADPKHCLRLGWGDYGPLSDAQEDVASAQTSPVRDTSRLDVEHAQLPVHHCPEHFGLRWPGLISGSPTRAE